MHNIVNTIVPLGVCVIMPVMIVWLTTRCEINRQKCKADILMKAIEAGKAIDTDKLTNALTKQSRTPKEVLNLRLLRGCIFSLIGAFLVALSLIPAFDIEIITPAGISLSIGIAYLIVYFVTRKEINASAERDNQ